MLKEGHLSLNTPVEIKMRFSYQFGLREIRQLCPRRDGKHGIISLGRLKDIAIGIPRNVIFSWASLIQISAESPLQIAQL